MVRMVKSCLQIRRGEGWEEGWGEVADGEGWEEVVDGESVTEMENKSRDPRERIKRGGKGREEEERDGNRLRMERV